MKVKNAVQSNLDFTNFDFTRFAILNEKFLAPTKMSLKWDFRASILHDLDLKRTSILNDFQKNLDLFLTLILHDLCLKGNIF
jgi:hypothetical protein